jgi:pentatricopeptide repeat protein
MVLRCYLKEDTLTLGIEMELEEFLYQVGTEGNGKDSGQPYVIPRSMNKNVGNVVNFDNDVGESRWSEGDGVFWRAKKTHSILPSGLYNCFFLESIGACLKKQELKTDDLLILPEKNSELIINEFEKFWNLKNKFIDFGYLYKRGFLLWGPPGSGKTSLINMMMKSIIENNNGIIVIVDDPAAASICLSMIRKNEPERPLITIMEDLDALIAKWGETGYLNLLDGSEQINNVIHIGTTNYPRKLDKRFVDRPSRFDTIVKINMPGRAARESYFRYKLDDKKLDWWNEEILELWTNETKGFSIAHLREIIISVCCLEQNFEEVIARLEKMHERKFTEDDEQIGPIGFVGSKKDNIDF